MNADFGAWAICHEVLLVEDRLQRCWPRGLRMVVIITPVCNKWHERQLDPKWRDLQ